MTFELDENTDWGLVAYTDGSANPTNPGPCGYGAHCYIYPIGVAADKPKAVKYEKDDVVKYAVATETGYKYCDRLGAITMNRDKQCVIVNVQHIVELAGSTDTHQSNNHAELNSFLQALDLAIYHKVKKVHFLTDSEYVIKGVTERCKNWSTNGWLNQKGEPVANKELWMVVWDKLSELKKTPIKIGVSYVKGHADQPGNIEADILANIGALKSRDELVDSCFRYYTPKQYYEPQKSRHPLLSLKRIYFNREAERNIPGVYYMADPGKDDQLIGKPLPEAVYAVVCMNEPHPVIDAILKRQSRYGQEFNETMTIHLDSIFTNDSYRLASVHGQYAFRKAPRSSNVEFVDGKPASIERKPIGITMRAIDSLNILDEILTKIKPSLLQEQEYSSLDDPEDLRTRDITDTFYDRDLKQVGKEKVLRWTLKKDYVVGFRDFKLEHTLDFSGNPKQVVFPMQMGADLPTRNALKQLETDRPKIYLITWRDSDLSVRYASAIKCDSGVAIWSNFYADRLVVGK